MQQLNFSCPSHITSTYTHKMGISYNIAIDLEGLVAVSCNTYSTPINWEVDHCTYKYMYIYYMSYVIYPDYLLIYKPFIVSYINRSLHLHIHIQ